MEIKSTGASSAQKRAIARKKAKRARRRRMARIFLVCSPVIIIALIAAGVVGAAAMFKVEGYAVTGTQTYTPEQVFEASGIEKGSGLLFCDLDSAAEKVCTTLPYIESVEVKRKLPDTVTFTAKAAEVRLVVESGSTRILLSTTGKVLEVTGEEPDAAIIRMALPQEAKLQVGFPAEFGVDTENTPIKLYDSVMKAVDATSLKGGITAVNFENPDDITIIYASRIRLHLGAPTQLAEKLSLAAGAVEQENQINPEQRGEMDLTVAQKLYFRPDAPSK